MRTHQYVQKKKASQSSRTSVPRPTEASSSVQPQLIQAMSNKKGLAEHAERLKKFQRLGNSMIQMGPPRLDNDKTNLLQPKPWIQPKLTIGEPRDTYEQEADRTASQVVQQINAPASKEDNLRQSIQREKDLEGEMQAKCFRASIQRRHAITGGEVSPDLESAINSARSAGKPLDAGLQQSMGQAMGADFSGVRVHTDAQSDQLNQSIQARAFTTGQDVFFREGAYQPGNRGGQELIAHELTHVVQQNGNSVIRSQTREFVNPQEAITAATEPMITVQRQIGKGGRLNQSLTVVGPKHTLFKVMESITFLGVLNYNLENLESGSTHYVAWNDDNYELCEYDADFLGVGEVRRKLGWVDLEHDDEVREMGEDIVVDDDPHYESEEMETIDNDVLSDIEKEDKQENVEKLNVKSVIKQMLKEAPVWTNKDSRPTNVVKGQEGGTQRQTCENWVKRGLKAVKKLKINCQASQMGWGEEGSGHTALYLSLSEEKGVIYDGWAQICCDANDYLDEFKKRMQTWENAGLYVCAFEGKKVLQYSKPKQWGKDLITEHPHYDPLWDSEKLLK